MTGQECADACETLANFFDEQRDFTCDEALIQRPPDASGISINVDVGHYDPSWTDQYPKPDQTYPGGITCRFLRAWLPLNELRPRASTAFRALGSVATGLEVDIFEANGSSVDSIVSTAPRLTLCCVANPDGSDKIASFLDSREHYRDDQQIPYVVTEYRNHRGKPIVVQLSFHPKKPTPVL